MQSSKHQFFILIILNLLITLSCLAQEPAGTGARSFGMAQTSITLSDGYSVFNNPGSLGSINKNSITFSYLSLYRMESLGSVFSSFAKKIKTGGVSVGVVSQGHELYNRSKVVLGLGNNFGIASLGLSGNYHQWRIEGFGSRGFISLDFGGVAQIGSFVKFGGLVRNITQTRISNITNEYLPTVMSVGLSYQPSEQLLLSTQYDKDLELEGILRMAIEYKISSLVLRTGMITDPAHFSFGAGLNHKSLKIDYGVMNHPVLRMTHSFSLSLHIGK